MKVLLDTCALSELRRPKPNAAVLRTIDVLASDDLFVSVLSVAEIAKGIAGLATGKKKRGLQLWLHTLERHYADRLLPVDLEISRLWGEVTAAAQKNGRVIPAVDGLIAATARRHCLHVMTRNTADFESAGALVLNPWAETA